MTNTIRNRGMFPALLKYWRGNSGMSQLDLALAADVSARHVSFMETGRAKPSEDMVLRLGATLRVGLRDQNAMLQAAGFEAFFDEEESVVALSGPIAAALDRMLHQQEPYPMVVMDQHYNVLKVNEGARNVLYAIAADPTAFADNFNAMRSLFDPRLLRPYVVGWERLAHGLLSRMHREALHNPHDTRLAALVASLLEYPDVPEAWRQPDFSIPSEATLNLHLHRDDLKLGFLTTVTAFNAPQNVTLEELRIESYFPLDEETTRTCQLLANKAS